jgi:flagellar basal-body rod modification protein FlgD
MAVSPVSSAQGAYGLDFQSLLQIVLKELTYQDPLNPVSNYEFVSQLGQFSQLQLAQTLNDNMTQLLGAQAATQATELLGRTADVTTNGTTISGKVTAVTFSNGTPAVTIVTGDGTTIGNLSIASINQVR